MSIVETAIDLAAPPEKVWDVIMDPRRLGDWVTIHRSLDHFDTGPLHPGFHMEQHICLRGATFKVAWTLAECRRGEVAVWEGRGPAFSKARTEYRLSPTPKGTHFDYRNEFTAPFGPLGAVASRALVGGVPRREADRSLKRLQSIL